MKSFLRDIPKVELHIHIEGSLEPELMYSIAQRNNISLPYPDVERLKQAYEFEDLQSFLDIYYQGAQILIHEQDFYDMAMAYFTKCREDNVVHTEMFFDPQTHTDRGITFETVINGLTRAMADAQLKWGITSELIMCFLRHLSAEAAMQTLEMALPFKDKIIAVGLDSSEVGFPPDLFTAVFEKALQAGFKTVAHAGEEGPPEYIWQALNNLKVSRIDHGVRCVEDPELVDYLVEKNIPLTVCPTSNVKLRVFDTMADHNILRMLQQGLAVTINSDDPAYFGGYITDNYLQLNSALNMSKEQAIKLTSNAISASFATESRKTDMEKILSDAVNN
jgi:adenosine deaminase